MSIPGVRAQREPQTISRAWPRSDTDLAGPDPGRGSESQRVGCCIRGFNASRRGCPCRLVNSTRHRA